MSKNIIEEVLINLINRYFQNEDLKTLIAEAKEILHKER